MTDSPMRLAPPPALERVRNLTPYAHFQCDKMGPRRIYYDVVVLKATFEFDCTEPWCEGAKTDVPVLRVEHLDGYRATVVRSTEGPPDQVLHLSFPSKN